MNLSIIPIPIFPLAEGRFSRIYMGAPRSPRRFHKSPHLSPVPSSHPRPSDVAICIMETLQTGGPASSIASLVGRINEDLDIGMWVDMDDVSQAIIELLNFNWIEWWADAKRPGIKLRLTKVGLKAVRNY